MGIGMLVLYAALAVVALWLVAELLLQNRAPLHWRGAALGGFLLVVAGMATRSVVLIGVGAVVFAAGQVLVTLAVKRGEPAGWSLRAADGSLPGPLARVPLLGALTGGAAVAGAAAVAADAPVGEVGPIEEPAEELLPESAQDAVSDGLDGPVGPDDYGVYQAVGYEQQQPAGYPQYGAVPYAGSGYPEQGYPAYPEQQQYPVDPYGVPYAPQPYPEQGYQFADPSWQQQPGYGYQPEEYGQGYQQQPYPEQGYQQQAAWPSDYQQPGYQQQYGGIPQQPGHEYQPQPGGWPQ
ncbi:hypothetical protein ACIGXM_17290 [Kitasatospora sp. NPDC052896]|uniref:hypothetical protein n=1 Tax=Kitasatospora sp. NPDC052896 TaxID=3364061 RepID=UPI0037CC9EF8